MGLHRYNLANFTVYHTINKTHCTLQIVLLKAEPYSGFRIHYYTTYTSSNLGYCDLHLVTIAHPNLTLNDYGRSS